MSCKWGRRASILRLRATACLGVALFLAISLGCMSFNLGKTEVVQRDDALGGQCGKCQLAAGEELTIYYPFPYHTPPNLEIDCGAEWFRILEQSPDHFKVKNISALPREISWKSRGVKLLPPGTIVPGVLPVGAVVTEAQSDVKKASLTVEPAPMP